MQLLTGVVSRDCNPGFEEPGETRTLYQTRNVGLGGGQNPQVLGLRFCTKSTAFNGVDNSKHVFDYLSNPQHTVTCSCFLRRTCILRMKMLSTTLALSNR